MPCLTSKDGSIAICKPSGYWRYIDKKRVRKWCFKCRKHLLHKRRYFVDTVGWYGPSPIYFECKGCGKDNTTFPGY